MTIIRIRTLSGTPIDSFPDDYPFRVEVVVPREGDEDPPKTITITIETEDGSETLEIAWTGNLSGDPVYKSNPITMEAGAVGSGKIAVAGFEFSSGDMDGMETADGEEVTISYDDDSSTVKIYDSWYTLAFVQLRRFFDMAEAFWKSMRDQFAGQDGAEATSMVALAEKKLRLVEKGRNELENENNWPAERVAGATYLAGLIRTKLEVDERLIFDTLNQRRRTAKEKAEEVIWEQVMNIVLGFYALITNMTSAAQVYMLFSGEDIFGKQVSLSERILAAVDIASGVAGEAAGILINLKRIKKRSKSVATTKVERGVNPENVGLGVYVDPWDFGVLKQSSRHARFVADKFGVIIEIRPANLESMRWQGLGHPRKPEAIKQKTINALDVHLGASKKNIGLVGHFKPKKPTRTAGMDDATWAAVQKRYNQRLEAWDTFNPKMKKLEKAGQVKLEDGVIIDTGLCGDTNKAITGDLDPWAFRDRKTGRTLTADEAKPVVDALRGGGFDAQHGAHTNWKPVDDAGKSIDAAIRKRHQQRTAGNPEGGNESILVIGGRADGPARTTFSDAPFQQPVIEKGGVPKTPPAAAGEGRLPLTELRQGIEAATTEEIELEAFGESVEERLDEYIEGVESEEPASEEIVEEKGPYSEQTDRDWSEFDDYIETGESPEPEEWSVGDEEPDESIEGEETSEPPSEEIVGEEKGPYSEQTDRDWSEFDDYRETGESPEPEEWSVGDEDTEDSPGEEIIDEDLIKLDEWDEEADEPPDGFIEGGEAEGELVGGTPDAGSAQTRAMLPWIVGGIALLMILAFGLRALIGGGPEPVEVPAETNTPTATNTETAVPGPADYMEQLSRDPEMAGRIVTGRQMLQLGMPGADMLAFANLFTADNALDYVYSIEDISCGLFSNLVDMMYFFGGTVYLTEDAEGPIFNDSLFECGQIGERTVVCPDNVLPMPGGEMVVAVMVLAEPLPEPIRDPDPNGNPILQPGEDQHIYAFVADTDGDPANNFQFQPPYNWDYFQGTDVWYQLTGNPSSGTWIAVVGGPRYGSQVDSAMRAVIEGDTITFFIPADEFGDLDQVRYRLSAFQHDGSYRAAVSSGDVSGENPAQEPIPLIRTGIEVYGPSEDTLALVLNTPSGESAGSETENETPTPVPPMETAQATITPTSTPMPSPTATVAALDPETEQAIAFIAAMNAAHEDGDSRFLYSHLHEAVLERYGPSQCQLYLEQVAGSISDLEATDVVHPVDFTYSTDGVGLFVPDAVRLEIRYVAQGETHEGVMHILLEDGEGKWFTDCGQPLSP
ncbi:MAG: hypothetical protein JXA97_12510 [Anaerolineales bacterium]|nr:hypothetical protein [Anaerolineales bacterium]